jgi:hypothetical protein
LTTDSPTRNILVIQLGDIGDVVLATASFHALKDHLPGARVHALVRKGCGALLAADPNLVGIYESRRGGGKLPDVAPMPATGRSGEDSSIPGCSTASKRRHRLPIREPTSRCASCGPQGST